MEWRSWQKIKKQDIFRFIVFMADFEQGERWYTLSSSLAGRKISQFIKGRFFEVFSREICHVRVKDSWRESGEHVRVVCISERRSLFWSLNSFPHRKGAFYV